MWRTVRREGVMSAAPLRQLAQFVSQFAYLGMQVRNGRGELRQEG